MAGARIEITTDDREVRQALDRLADSTRDTRPLLKAIGELLTESTKQRFATSTAPDGTPWEPNSPVTELLHLQRFKGSLSKRKTKTGGRTLTTKGQQRLAAKKPLIGESKSLSRSINWRLVHGGAAVGSPMVYAGVQQFGPKLRATGDWAGLIEAMNLKGLYRQLAENAELLEQSAGRVRLRLAEAHQNLATPGTVQRLEEALKAHFGAETRLVIETAAEVAATPAVARRAGRRASGRGAGLDRGR